MKDALITGLWVAIGIAIYQVAAYGFSGADWYKVVFIGVFVAVMSGIFKWPKTPTSK